MAFIEISSVTGTSPYQLFVSDIYGNNETLIGSFSGSVPPAQYFSVPKVYDTAPIVKIVAVGKTSSVSKSIIMSVFIQTLYSL